MCFDKKKKSQAKKLDDKRVALEFRKVNIEQA